MLLIVSIRSIVHNTLCIIIPAEAPGKLGLMDHEHWLHVYVSAAYVKPHTLYVSVYIIPGETNLISNNMVSAAHLTTMTIRR